MSSGFRATNTKTQLFFHPPPSSSLFLSGVWNVCSYFVCMIPPATFELRAVSEVCVFVLNLSSISLWMKESQKSVECKKNLSRFFSPLVWSLTASHASWTTLFSSNSCIWWDWLVLHELAKKHKANQSFVGEIKGELRQFDSSKSEDYMWKYEAFRVSTRSCVGPDALLHWKPLLQHTLISNWTAGSQVALWVKRALGKRMLGIKRMISSVLLHWFLNIFKGVQ